MTEAPEPYAPRAPGTSTGGALAFLMLGPIVWGLHLGAIYAVQGAICALGGAGARLFGIDAVVFVVVAPTVLATAALAAAMILPRAAARPMGAHGWSGQIMAFLTGGMRLLALLSIFGVVWAGATVAIIPGCPPLR